MRLKVLGIALFVVTALAVVFYPAASNVVVAKKIEPTPVLPVLPVSQAPNIEVVFVLDTTGSMGGLIHAAKEKIWSIASSMAAAKPAPTIKMGLVAYRDRGDDYVTQVVNLSDDLDSMYARLMDYQASGGGDGPESVNQALHDAVHKISWSNDQQSYKVIFLLGDAPPHMDYQDDVKYPETLKLAKQRGIVVNAIQCGENGSTLPIWQQIAQLGNGRYFQVEQAGGAVAIDTPFDARIAELSAELDETRLYYGDASFQEEKQRKVKATEKLHTEASIASRARRGIFNSTKAGLENLFGEGELLSDIEAGRVDAEDVPVQSLPEPMQAMSKEERREYIEENSTKRAELQQQIQELAEQRKSYIKEELKKKGSTAESLDESIYSAVREQAATKGLHYEAAGSAH